jgi:ADP-ribosylglycohydrolase
VSQLLDKIRGTLLGGLCGDEIGRPAECLDYQTIAARFGRIAGPQPRPGKPAGTDDSALKHMLCQAIMQAEGEVTPDDWAAVWRESMQPEQFWIPVQSAYFRLMVQKIPPAEVGVGTMVSNSSAMCIAPIGIVNAGNPGAACREALSAARLIHRGFPLDAAGAVAAAVAEAFRADATRDTIITAACAHLPAASEMIDAIESGVALARASDGYDDFRARFYAEQLQPWPHRHDGWSIAVDPRESVPAALGILYLADGDPAETILGCANFGRDADTIATIGGAIAGALRGGARIPTTWIEAVTAAGTVDQEELAKDLLAVLLRRAERAASWGAMVLGSGEQ